ncbi:MAG TPA: hypothetical protein VFW96_29400 [Thermomicrobiales bacterium]|nr:hypothetical protein [Thermomicrobiales bacterium]
MRVYQVTGAGYAPGDDLLCWDILEREGVVRAADWRWPDAPGGYYGRAVCVYETLAEAREHLAGWGGVLLAIDLPDTLDALAADSGVYRTDSGSISPRPSRVAEGYLAFRGGIPAAWAE